MHFVGRDVSERTDCGTFVALLSKQSRWTSKLWGPVWRRFRFVPHSAYRFVPNGISNTTTMTPTTYSMQKKIMCDNVILFD